MLSVTGLVLSLFALGASANKFEFYTWGGHPGAISYGRLDPVISPGRVSQHVHMFQGANGLEASYDYDNIRKRSTCSSITVQEDLSNYWSPAMYSYDGKGYTLMTTRFSIYYGFGARSYDPNDVNGSPVRYAFPKGLVMLAGNMYQRTINYSDPFSTATVFQCQRSAGDSPYSHDMRDFQKQGINCDNQLRATIGFPSCWDGSSDANYDNTHVVYPDWGVCPRSHPFALMELLYEWYFPVQDHPFDPSRTDNWVLSFGDTSGFGLHADFTNGWNIPLLQQAIDTCNTTNSFGFENCPVFSKWFNTQAQPCMASGLYPNEDVGLSGNVLAALPGCNPLWTDNSTKATCPGMVDPPINVRWGPDLSKWNYVACPFSYNGNGGAMEGPKYEGWSNMTVDICLNQCAAGNYTWAMVTWGSNCYCDTEIRNGNSLTDDPYYPCQQRCPSEYLQICGGYGSGVLFKACTGSDCHQNAVYDTPQTTAGFAWISGATTATPTPTVISVASTSAAVSVASTSAAVSVTSTSAALSVAIPTTTAVVASILSSLVTSSVVPTTTAPAMIVTTKTVTRARTTFTTTRTRYLA